MHVISLIVFTFVLVFNFFDASGRFVSKLPKTSLHHQIFQFLSTTFPSCIKVELLQSNAAAPSAPHPQCIRVTSGLFLMVVTLKLQYTFQHKNKILELSFKTSSVHVALVNTAGNYASL